MVAWDEFAEEAPKIAEFPGPGPAQAIRRRPLRGIRLDLRGQRFDPFFVADLAGASSVEFSDGQLTITIWKPGEGFARCRCPDVVSIGTVAG